MESVKRNTKSANGRFIAYRVDRLGARLNCLVNARRVGLKYGVPFHMHWFWTPAGYDCSEINDPTELFDQHFVAEHFLSAEAWREAQPQATRIGEWTDKSAALTLEQLGNGRDILVDRAFGIVCFADESANEAAVGFREAMDGIPFAPKLRQHQQRIAAALAQATAYHIRRGDLTTGIRTKHSPWPHKCIPDEFYLHHMAFETAKDQKVILFSDDEATLDRFKLEFPGILTFQDLVDRSTLGPGARDLLELYAMSRCNKIVAPEQSAFSSTAAELGASRKIDVVEDLDATSRDLAYSDLLTRLQERPESFANEGEVAQMLVHLFDWCVTNDRLNELVSLQERHVAEGMTIAFVFPMLMRNQLVMGNTAGALESGRCMDRIPILHDKSFAEAEALRALAFVAEGDRTKAVRHISRALSISPQPTNVRKLTTAFMHAGILTPQNFLPVPEEVLNLRQPGFKPDKDRRLHEVLCKTLGIEETRYIPALDPVFLDWGDLIGGNMGKDILRKGRHETYFKRQASLDTPDVRAFILGLQARDAANSNAAKALVKLAADFPDKAYIQFQLSRSLALRRDRHAAFSAISLACEIAPDVPAYAAIGADLAFRTRHPEQAITWYKRSMTGLPGMANVHAKAAECLFALKEEADALNAIRCARALDPANGHVGGLEAKILRKMGRILEAGQVLEGLAQIDRLTKQTFFILAEIYLETGQTAQSLETVERGLERDPDFLPLRELKLRLQVQATPFAVPDQPTTRS